MSQETDERAAETSAAPPLPDAAAPTPAAPSAARDEFDPAGWAVPVVCKDCSKDFSAPYRHFKAGVVFHCPHCHGSFVPLLKMYHAVRDVFETFYTKRKREREEFARTGGDQIRFDRKQAAELEEFRKALATLAQTMRPAGKMVKPKGFRAMFT
ncbi:MAG: hypothetical protein ACREQC_12440 [Candidatus Binataceae bacterium]